MLVGRVEECALKNFIGSYKSGERMIKPCGLISVRLLTRITHGRRHGQMVGGQGIASIARSKAVDSAIDSHALGGLKTECVLANSTGRQTEVLEQKIVLSTSVEPEVARPRRH